jgi:hypothetical protein
MLKYVQRPKAATQTKYSDAALERKRLTLFVAQNLPFHFVEEQEFCDIIEFLHPGARPPTRHRLQDVLQETFNTSVSTLRFL